MEKMAILQLKSKTMCELLGLPEGCEVIGAEMAPGYRGVVRLTLAGAGWHTSEGAPIVPARVATMEDGVIDLGLPA